MDFGKLPNVDHIDFSLPPDPVENIDLLRESAPRQRAPIIYLGATGYNMKAWVGRWYPPGAKDKAFLSAYGDQFNTIEHNTTHYRIPDAGTVARWRDETPEDFRYCPKIPQTISHAHDLGLQGVETPLFCELIAGLKEKMGCCFIQSPPQFSVQQLPLLARFLAHFPTDLAPLAVEIRHPSFFKGSAAAQDFFRLLQTHDAPTVITDVAGRRDVCHMRLSSNRVLIRFVGNSLHPTDYTRIEDWATRLAYWFGLGLREFYFFCHEPDNLLAPELAVFAASAFLKTMPEAILRAPEPCPPPPRQGVLFTV